VDIDMRAEKIKFEYTISAEENNSLALCFPDGLFEYLKSRACQQTL